MNITEDYVSFETAKLLKEKGFPQSGENTFCIMRYFKDSVYEIGGELIKLNEDIARPIQSVAMRWLREEKNIIITTRLNTSIYTERINYSFIIHQLYTDGWFHKKFVSDEYLSYEEAIESAIKYCLENLI